MDLSHLNKAQQQAVTSTEGAYMVIAGAGSGKTSVLTHRIAYLLEATGIDPFNILALTFTNKAANEMRQRVEKMVGPVVKSLWLGTFHSIFARILRKEADRLGYPLNFTIYDTDDSKSLLRSIIKEMNLDDKVYKPNVVLARISSAKNRLITAQAYANSAIYQADDESARKPRMGEIFLKYVGRCFKAGAMDFDDLLLNNHQLFSQVPGALSVHPNRRVPRHQHGPIYHCQRPRHAAQKHLCCRRRCPKYLCISRCRHPQHPQF
jgi:DNA helicase II / ATP-dependent DNA helicase PcrA